MNSLNALMNPDHAVAVDAGSDLAQAPQGRSLDVRRVFLSFAAIVQPGFCQNTLWVRDEHDPESPATI
jgi:hypothetical protein